MDDTLAEVSSQLQQQHFCILDNFVLPSQTAALRAEVRRAHERGLLHPGGLAGGRAGQATSYSLAAVRGDYAGRAAPPAPAPHARRRRTTCGVRRWRAGGSTVAKQPSGGRRCRCT